MFGGYCVAVSLWQKYDCSQLLRRFSAKPWRAVEAQHKVVTRKLVDSLEEQVLLEALLENSKPPYAQPQDARLHYLLSTPFRYPPLKYGSRFGTRQQRGLWYGSARIKTALREVAFYRIKFLQASEARLDTVYADFTLFKASIKTSRGFDLTREPFDKHKAQLTHSSNYRLTQELGTQMRDHNVHAFRFFSARDKDNGINIAVFNAQAFDQNNPLAFEHWHSVSDINQVEFIKRDLLNQLSFRFTAQSLGHK